MTNYEYLVLTDRITDFMNDVSHYYDEPYVEPSLKRWNIPVFQTSSIGGDIAKWLQEESRFTNAYINFIELIKFMKESDLFDLTEYHIRKLETIFDTGEEENDKFRNN